MEISNRPAAQTDSRHAETSAPRDLCCAHKVHLKRATRAVRNASATVHPAIPWAHIASPVRPRAELTVHRRESRRVLPRLAPVRTPEPFLLQNRERLCLSIFPSPTTPIFSLR